MLILCKSIMTESRLGVARGENGKGLVTSMEFLWGG
jgi:hypothetical protein